MKRRWAHKLVLAACGLGIATDLVTNGGFILNFGPQPATMTVDDIGKVSFRHRPETDLGVPLPTDERGRVIMRPDDSANWRGIVRAQRDGGPQREGEYGCWDWTPIQESTHAPSIYHARRICFWVWGLLDCNAKYKPGHIPDFSDKECARWAWLFETGRAGWRTVRHAYRVGMSAEEHHDIRRGWMHGATLSAVGWTIRTYGGGATVAYLADAGGGGNDANSGLASNLPKLTLAAAKGLLTDPGYNAILVKRGSTFSGAAWPFIYFSGSWKGWSGTDATHRFEVGAYGSGARPIIDIAGGGDTIMTISRCVYASFYDLDLTDSTYNGIDNVTGIYSEGNTTPTSNDVIIENFRIHGIGNGAYFADNNTNYQLRRCYFYDNFSCGEGVQFGGGLLDATTNFLTEDNVFYKNGWNDTIQIMSQAVTADSGATVDVGSVPANAVDDSYIGNLCTITGGATPPSNGPFRVTDYVDASKRFTLSPTPNTSSTGSTLKLFGGTKGVFKHSMYCHYSWAQYEGTGNIVVNGSDHGMGRRLGTLYFNFCEGSAVPMLANSGAAHTGGAAGGNVHHNALIGQQTNDTFKGGIGAYFCFSGEATFGAGDNSMVFDENICHMLLMTDAAVSIRLFEYTMGASAASGTQITNSVFYNSYNTGYSFGQGVSLLSATGAGAYSLQTLVVWQLHNSDKLVESNSSSNSFSSCSGNTYAKTVSTGCFATPTTNPETYANWLTYTGETGAVNKLDGSYTAIGAGRGLAEWDAATGGAGTQAAAMARIYDFDTGTGEWDRYNNCATWIVSYIRKGYGKAAIPYTSQPYPIPKPTSFNAQRSGADVATTWADPGAPDNPTDINHYSITRGGTEVATTTDGTATSKTVTAGADGTYSVKAVDWLGVEYEASTGVAVSSSSSSTPGRGRGRGRGR